MRPVVRVPYSLAGHAAAFVSRLAPAGGGKFRRAFAARHGTIERVSAWARAKRDLDRPLIWMHAPSVGEGLMARPVIELLRSSLPSAQFAYTFFSPSAETFARSLPVDVADYLPFDTATAARAMLNALAPSAIVFSKLDVWPLLVEEATARGVPVGLTSATFSESSGRGSWLARLVLADAYAALSAIGAVHEADAENLVALGARPECVSITGDVRYDQVTAQVSAGPRDPALLARLGTDRPTLVAGSTWSADEAVLLPAWRDVVRHIPSARLIIAAHEPTAAHTARLRAWARERGLPAASIGAADDGTGLVVVDRVGVLADLYALADVAFVGGGFHDRGLHSVVEPAAFGIPVLFGPRGVANRDAAALISAGGGFADATAPTLADRIVGLLASDLARKQPGASARQVITDGLGAAERSAALVERLLQA
ncbi:MAG: hypothetical protein O2973_09235 [Gemmatimonadetes bacterium]|nr:hypothetical protein [Gemmatimonadota bacterium]